MATLETSARDSRHPPMAGALAYLVLNLPAGIAGFVVVVPLVCVGLGTAAVWVGVPILAVTVLICRAGCQLEQARVRACSARTSPAPTGRCPAGCPPSGRHACVTRRPGRIWPTWSCCCRSVSSSSS